MTFILFTMTIVKLYIFLFYIVFLYQTIISLYIVKTYFAIFNHVLTVEYLGGGIIKTYSKDYTKLDEEIYMICFSEPRYPSEIKELLSKSGRTTQQSQLLLDNPNSRITKLITKGWIKELTNNDKQKIIKEINDKRSKRRRYIQSTFDPLIDYIKQQIPLAKNEERQLKHLLEKKSFRPIFSWELGFRTFESVKEFLSQLTLWTYIADKYVEPYRIKKETVAKIGKKKLFSDISNQIMEKRKTIAERIAPDLEIDLSSFKEEQYYPFIEDLGDKLKPPLFNKLMKLSNNQIIFFDIAISLLACGEFMNKFQQK